MGVALGRTGRQSLSIVHGSYRWLHTIEYVLSWLHTGSPHRHTWLTEIHAILEPCSTLQSIMTDYYTLYSVLLNANVVMMGGKPRRLTLQVTAKKRVPGNRAEKDSSTLVLKWQSRGAIENADGHRPTLRNSPFNCCCHSIKAWHGERHIVSYSEQEERNSVVECIRAEDRISSMIAPACYLWWVGDGDRPPIS